VLTRRSCLASLAALTLTAAIAPPALAEAPRKPLNLFVIQRSKNADEAHYDARLNKDGNLDGSECVDGYFMNKDPQGNWFREDFTWIQKRAYGWDVSSSGGGSFALKLRAFPNRAMWVVKANNSGRFRVQTTIAGKPAFLSKLYVATDESGIMPKVLYVDVFGEDISTGAALTEHLNG
jgi:hypothetical protein